MGDVKGRGKNCEIVTLKSSIQAKKKKKNKEQRQKKKKRWTGMENLQCKCMQQKNRNSQRMKF